MAPGDEIGTIVEHGPKLRGQAALSDPGLTDDGHQLHGRLALDAKEGLDEKRPLVLAADERGLRRRLGLSDTASGLQRSPGPDRIGLPFRHDAVVLLVHDRPFGRMHRRLVDDDGPDRSCRLEARGSVHDVTGDDSLPTLRPRAERDHRLACRHGRANGDLQSLLAELLDGPKDAQCRSHRALGVVLVRQRRSEDGHHGIADELLHRSTEALDVGLDALVVRTEGRADVLGIRSIGAIREADEVHEEDGDDLPLLTGGRGGGRELVPAGEAETCSLRVHLAALGARHHIGIFSAPASSVYAAGGRGSSSSSARRRCNTLRESTPMSR